MGQILAAGTAAPEFTLHVTPDQLLSLTDLKGKPVILAFYPADWAWLLAPSGSEQRSFS
jgi:peroxiredoxin